MGTSEVPEVASVEAPAKELVQKPTEQIKTVEVVAPEEAKEIPEATSPETNPKSDVSELSEEEPVESEEPVEDSGLEESEFLEEPDEFDSEVSEEPSEFGEDSELSEEPTQASYEEEPDQVDAAESNQEQPEDSAVTGEEAKELDAHEKPTEEVKVAPKATPVEVPPAEVAVENKTQDQV